MPKTPIVSFKKIIFISFLSLIAILVLSILLNFIICGVAKRCFSACVNYPPTPDIPSTLISYNSNCNLPPQGNSKAEIRNRMTALYACSVQSNLEKYKDKKITLENPKTQSELIQQLFETGQIKTNRLIYDSGNWQIYFWSPRPDQVFQTENYKVHTDAMESSGKGIHDKMAMSENMKVSKMAPSREIVLAQPEIIIKVGDKFEALNYKHILAITGFETETQMLDFVLIHNKLLGQNKKIWQKDNDTKLDFEIRNSVPLLFLQDYNFSNKNDEGDLKFRCYENYQANLKTEINLDKKEIVYFAHPTQNSLSKIKLWLENGDLKYEIKNELNCNNDIIC